MANEVKETKVEKTPVETVKVEETKVPTIEVKAEEVEKPSFGKALKTIGAGLAEFGRATVSGAKKIAPVVGVAAAAAGGFALYNAMKDDKDKDLEVIDLEESDITESTDDSTEE